MIDSGFKPASSLKKNPPVFYVDIGNETRKRKFSHTSRAKNTLPKLRKASISNCDRDLVNCISECVLNVLNGNVALTSCVKRNISKHRLALRRLVDRRVT